MIQVRCPKCSTALALKQAPAAGKVKCPKCATIIAVAPTAPSAAPQAAPKKPVSQAPPAARSDAGEIDFRTIPSSPAPSLAGNFPMPGDRKIYDGPIALDPLPKQKTGDEDEDDEEEVNAVQSPTPSKNKKSKQAKTIVLISVLALVLVVGGGVAFWKFGGGGSDAASVDVGALAAAAAPSGYQAKMLLNCVVLMPKGSWGKDKPPSSIQSELVMSEATESVFLLAVMDGGLLPIDSIQMKKKASRALGGDILGGQDCERNGYKGIQGVVDGSLFVPRMSVEIFHHEGRFAIIGYVAGSALQAAGGGAATATGSDEIKEAEVFYKSFKIGPPPGGFFSN